MRLCDAIHVRRGDIVSLVGAGGKTSAMYRLAGELWESGWRVVTTTTTMIYPPTRAQSQQLVVEADAGKALSQVADALGAGRATTLATRRLEAEGKLLGIGANLIPKLARLADVVIVEADGARARSLKAPADHEPVVPAATTVLIPVVGIDAVGHRIDEERVHRPELLARLTGHAAGDTISTSMVAKLLVSAEGALKRTPTTARVMPLLNKVEDQESLANAREIADKVRSDVRIDAVLIGSMQSPDPIAECQRRVSAIVLAAGGATRFGQPKQLLTLAGKTVIEHVLQALHDSSVFEIIVVLGHAAQHIAPHIPSYCGLTVNPDWQEGLSTSIRTGLQAVSPATHAALLVQADQPRIQSEDINRVLQAYYGTSRSIVVPFHRGQRGTPALFGRRHFEALAGLRGDVGGRQLIKRFPDEVLPVEFPSARAFTDIDTPADYQHLLNHCDDTGADA